MNDLIPAGMFPDLEDEIRRAADVFSRIRSFKDIENSILRGFGLSPRTYAVYLSTVRQLYYFTGRELPSRVTPAQIEAFFDAIQTGYTYTDDAGSVQTVKVDRGTAVSKIAALKTFYRHLEEQFPVVCKSPFRKMPDELLKKLSRKPDTGKKTAMSAEEASRILEHLKHDETLKGRSNYAIVRFLLASGLRAAELCGLSWDDIEQDPGADCFYARGIGKGGKPFYQQVADDGAVTVALDAFRSIMGRDPEKQDPVFPTLPRFKGDTPGRMTPHALWYRIRDIGADAKAAGIVTRKFQFSPHLMRRTAGTILDAGGMSLVGIQAFLRHSSPVTTEKHYIDNRQDARQYMTIFKQEAVPC